jgi:hypothetical protein
VVSFVISDTDNSRRVIRVEPGKGRTACSAKLSEPRPCLLRARWRPASEGSLMVALPPEEQVESIWSVLLDTNAEAGGFLQFFYRPGILKT